MQSIRKKNLAVVNLMIGLVFYLQEAPAIKSPHNTLKNIQALEGKLNLVLVRDWGGEHEENENNIFYEPMDVAIDNENRIYILEESKIKVFDNSGQYLRTMGRKGDGPGDLYGALCLEIDKQGNLVIADAGNQRTQILSSEGKFIGSFPLSGNLPGPIAVTQNNEILMSNRTLTTEKSSLWIYYDYRGQILWERGERKGGSSVLENNMRNEFAFVLDKKDSLYTAAIYRPIIHKYAPTGELQMESSFEVPFRVPEIKAFKRAEGVFIEAEAVCRGIDRDSRNRIFLLALTRPKKEEERKIGYVISTLSHDGKRSTVEKMKFNLNSAETDLYQILVFNDSGKIEASKKVNVYANKIRIHKNRLFLIDSYVNMMIYEYEILDE